MGTITIGMGLAKQVFSACVADASDWVRSTATVCVPALQHQREDVTSGQTVPERA